MKVVAGISTILLLMSSMLVAQQQPEQKQSGFYVGAGIGASEYDDDDFFRGQNLDNNEVGAKLYGGYRFNQYISAELALAGLGSFQNDSFGSEIDNDFSAVTMNAVASLPLIHGISLYGQGGIGLASVYQDIAYATPAGQLITTDDDSSGVAGIYGAGLSFIPAQFRLLEFRLGWERYDFSVDLTRVDSGIRSSDNVDQEIDLFFFGVALNLWH